MADSKLASFGTFRDDRWSVGPVIRSIRVQPAKAANRQAQPSPSAWFDRAPSWVTLFGLVPAIILARSVSEDPRYPRLRFGLVCAECHPALNQAGIRARFKNARFRVTVEISARTLIGPALERVCASPCLPGRTSVPREPSVPQKIQPVGVRLTRQEDTG